MENKDEVLSHEKPPTSEDRGQRRDPLCSLDNPSSRPDRRIARSLHTERCRECLGSIAHRLAQPMTALRGGIELGLMGKRTADDYRALLEQSLKLADNMVQLIVFLRDLAESGSAVGIAQSVSLRTQVEKVLAEMADGVHKPDLRLELAVNGPIEVNIDLARLHDALQNLLEWVVQNCACGGPIALNLSESDGMARMHITPTRMDLQYLQIKMLDDITPPGVLFSYAAKQGALGWAINHRLWEGLGGTLEMLSDGRGTRCICLSVPLAPTA